MNRIWSAVAVLLITVGLTAFSFVYNTDTINRLYSEMSVVMETVDKKDYNKAQQQLDKAENEWNGRKKIMLIFSSHDKPDGIEEALKISEVYLKNGDMQMFRAECKRLFVMIEQYRDIEYPEIFNIL